MTDEEYKKIEAIMEENRQREKREKRKKRA